MIVASAAGDGGGPDLALKATRVKGVLTDTVRAETITGAPSTASERDTLPDAPINKTDTEPASQELTSAAKSGQVGMIDWNLGSTPSQTKLSQTAKTMINKIRSSLVGCAPGSRKTMTKSTGSFSKRPGSSLIVKRRTGRTSTTTSGTNACQATTAVHLETTKKMTSISDGDTLARVQLRRIRASGFTTSLISTSELIYTLKFNSSSI